MVNKESVTIKDVAERAGVSRATVSRILTGSAKVSPAKEKVVREAIAEMGFQASVSAQRLATGRSDSIAVLLTEPIDELLSDPTYATILQGIMDAMTPTRYSPVLLMASIPRETHKTTKLLQRGAADAVIHLSPYTHDSLIEEVLDARIPLVLCGLPGAERPVTGFSAVYSDDIKGGQKIAQYLLGKDSKKLAIIMGPSKNPATVDRLQGIKSVFPTEQIVSIEYADWSVGGGFHACSDLIHSGIDFDSIACGNDRLAVGAIDALNDAGILVPQDVRITGFDDHVFAERSLVPLTTLKLPFRRQGKEAVCLAERMIEGDPPKFEVLPTQLIVRESA